VNDARDVTEDGEEDVDEEIRAAATLEDDAQRREDDGEDDQEDVAVVWRQWMGTRARHETRSTKNFDASGGGILTGR